MLYDLHKLCSALHCIPGLNGCVSNGKQERSPPNPGHTSQGPTSALDPAVSGHPNPVPRSCVSVPITYMKLPLHDTISNWLTGSSNCHAWSRI